jgi:hypothetical protein
LWPAIPHRQIEQIDVRIMSLTVTTTSVGDTVSLAIGGAWSTSISTRAA